MIFSLTTSHKRQGFTLIELLIAIGIMGILASVVIIAIGPAKALESVRNAERKMYIRQQENAGTQYVIGTGNLPSQTLPIGGDDAVSICRRGVTDSSCTNMDGLVPTYISDLAVDRAETSDIFTGYRMYTDHQRRIFVCSDYLPIGDADRCAGAGIARYCAPGAVYPIPSGGNTAEYATLIGTKLYVLNQISNSVSIVDTTADTVSSTIPVSTHPQYSLAVGTKLYVFHRSSAMLSVIDTTTDTVTASLTVGGDAQHAILVGTKMYVMNANAFFVSVVDTTTDTVIGSITTSPGGSGKPYYATLVGTNLYVSLTDVGTIKVIDTLTDTVTSTITAGAFPGPSYLLGTDLYFVNYNNNNVKVLNTLTNTFTATIAVGNAPYSGVLAGSTLYVMNYMGGTVSVINTATNTVSSTITVEGSPRYAYLFGGKLHVPTYAGADPQDLAWVPDYNYYIINTSDNSVYSRLELGSNPLHSVLVGRKVYILNNQSSNISVLDAVQSMCL